MSTAFEKIISGEWPGRFVWADEHCVAFATIEPITAGHVLVVPRLPYSSWTECPADLVAHLTVVARTIGLAQQRAFDVERSGLVIAGLEVPHTHLHVMPMRSEADIAFANASPATDAELDASMDLLRAALVDGGDGAHVPAQMSSPDLA